MHVFLFEYTGRLCGYMCVSKLEVNCLTGVTRTVIGVITMRFGANLSSAHQEVVRKDLDDLLIPVPSKNGSAPPSHGLFVMAMDEDPTISRMHGRTAVFDHPVLSRHREHLHSKCPASHI